MAQLLTWDAAGERFYETGVDHGVLYPRIADGTYPLGVAWNGLVTITESPEGAEPNALYADNIKYLNLYSVEELKATIEAYTYPDEWALCDGSVAPVLGVQLGQQERQSFGLCYRTLVGNDVEGTALGYKLHLLYGGMASPSEKGFESMNDSPDAITFSWEVSTIPEVVTGYKPTSLLTIDSRTADATKLAALEVILYGEDVGPTDARLPLPDEVITLMTPA
jgi:hypothetical protein